MRPTLKRRIAPLVIYAMLAALSAPVIAQEGVVARVNGVDITEADLAVAAQMFGPQLGEMPEDARRSVIVDALIDMKIISDAAKAAGLQTGADFARQMAFFEEQTLRALFFEDTLRSAVADEAVRQAYDAQVAMIPPVEELRISHILLPTLAEAQSVIDALNAGQDFVTLAKERSRDEASKGNGGDLGFRASGQGLPEVEAAATELSPGQFAATPVQSSFGYHVVRLEERRNRPAPAFEMVAAQIRGALESQAIQRISGELRAKTKVEKLIPDVAPPAGEDGHNHGTPPKQ